MRPDFLDVYKEQVWRVYAYLAYRLRSRDEAEDLTQLTFERALRAWSRFDERRASPATWLLTIARNALIDYQRREGARGGPDLPWEEGMERDARLTPGPDHDFGMDPELAAALSELSQREQSVLALRFGGDLQANEIAGMMDLSLANVQQILSRALRKLRRTLEPGEITAPLDQATEQDPSDRLGERTRTGKPNSGNRK